MATVAQTLQQLRNRRNLTLDQYNSTLVFIGDSITLRVYNAARCELAQVGFREIRAAPIVLPFITQHPQHHRYSQLRAHMKATSTENQTFGTEFGTAYTTDLQVSAETHFALLDGTFLTLVFLWRAGGERRGPGLCGDASTPHALLSVCMDLLRSFGPNTCVLYNERGHTSHQHDEHPVCVPELGFPHVPSTLHTELADRGACSCSRDIRAKFCNANRPTWVRGRVRVCVIRPRVHLPVTCT